MPYAWQHNEVIIVFFNFRSAEPPPQSPLLWGETEHFKTMGPPEVGGNLFLIPNFQTFWAKKTRSTSQNGQTPFEDDNMDLSNNSSGQIAGQTQLTNQE